MLLSEPARTQFDLNFTLAGFPVRVHPLFWLVTVILGADLMRQPAQVNGGVLLLIWIGSLFVSILVHELGHALAMRYYGQRSRIVLYMLGGLAIPESSPYSLGYGREANSSLSRIAISAAGPAAGFMLALLVIALVYLAGGEVVPRRDFPVFWSVHLGENSNIQLEFMVRALLWINILWGLVNLLPVFPLDGGQISRELCILYDAYTGVLRSVWLSLIVAILMVVAAISLREWYVGLLFGSLAFSSYMMLQQFQGGGFGGGFGGGPRGGRPW